MSACVTLLFSNDIKYIDQIDLELTWSDRGKILGKSTCGEYLCREIIFTEYFEFSKLLIAERHDQLSTLLNLDLNAYVQHSVCLGVSCHPHKSVVSSKP